MGPSHITLKVASVHLWARHKLLLTSLLCVQDHGITATCANVTASPGDAPMLYSHESQSGA